MQAFYYEVSFFSIRVLTHLNKISLIWRLARNLVIKQSGDTELSGIPLDLGESDFFKLGDSPRSRRIHFVQFRKRTFSKS